MNEKEFGFKIKAVLDEGLDLDPVVRARLRAAREQALSAGRQPVAIAELATAGTTDVRVRVSAVLVRVILPALMLIGLAFGWEHWRGASTSSASATDQLGALDADLLKSDIPLEALLDRDFHAYLRKAGEEESP